MQIGLCTLCLVTAAVCVRNVEREAPRRSFLARRAIDGSRGRKYFDPGEDGGFDSVGSDGGRYDPYREDTDLEDIRRNVPGEPGVDYPVYTRLPQTGFSCEGRSRGYYADEAAGCQVFHVCHDVLVSSFLCPIGSVFSQKLLTCDWWAKVDCASTEKYLAAQREASYQQDDDELIRNAYAMMSLHSGKDVTEDGLVDPDRTGTLMNYHRALGRIIDSYPPTSILEGTNNDLRHVLTDYPIPGMREFLSNYAQFQKRPETLPAYPGRFYPKDRTSLPPGFRDSRIIRIQKIESPQLLLPKKEYQKRPNDLHDHYRPSYAPTVPTVTTTTRRLYSPTVPTTYRPSTLAYSKLERLGQDPEEDQFFAQSNTRPVATPPTLIFPSESALEARQDPVDPRPVTLESFGSQSAFNYQQNYEEGPKGTESPLNENPEREFPLGAEENIEARGSIGLGQALHQASRKASLRQNTLERVDKEERKELNDTKMNTDSKKNPVFGPDGKTNPVSGPDGKIDPVFAPAGKTDPVVRSDDKKDPVLGPGGNKDSVLGPDGKNETVSMPLDYLTPPEAMPTEFRITVPEIPLLAHDQLPTSEILNSEKASSEESEIFETENESTTVSSAVDSIEKTGVEPKNSKVFKYDSDFNSEISREIDSANDSPYQISLPVASNLSSEVEEDSRNYDARNSTREFVVEIVRSVEQPTPSEFRGAVPLETPQEPALPTKLDSNVNILSLRQLMQELFKLDRLPRPFSPLSDSEEGLEAPPRETPMDEPGEIVHAEILEKLKENFGQPLYQTQNFFPRQTQNLSQHQAQNLDQHQAQNLGAKRALLQKDASRDAETSDGARVMEDKDIVTPSAENEDSVAPSAATFIGTEFVPAIGFSLDTNEGREEYAKAVLGGLLDGTAAVTAHDQERRK